jgi:hypothetical protein
VYFASYYFSVIASKIRYTVFPLPLKRDRGIIRDPDNNIFGTHFELSGAAVASGHPNQFVYEAADLHAMITPITQPFESRTGLPFEPGETGADSGRLCTFSVLSTAE